MILSTSLIKICTCFENILNELLLNTKSKQLAKYHRQITSVAYQLKFLSILKKTKQVKCSI